MVWIQSQGEERKSRALSDQLNYNMMKGIMRFLPHFAKVKPLLSFNGSERVIHAFNSAKLNYCNALYVGLGQSSISCLQLVQNAAARLLTRTRNHEHSTPVLASLHWLLINFRIKLKILLFAYKTLTGLALQNFYNLIYRHGHWDLLTNLSLLSIHRGWNTGKQSLCCGDPQTVEQVAPSD